MGKGRLWGTSGGIRGERMLPAPNESPALPHTQVPPLLVSIFPEAFNPSDPAPVSSGLFWSSLSSLPPSGSPDFPAVVCASDLVFQDLEGGGAERDGLEGDGQERLKG